MKLTDIETNLGYYDFKKGFLRRIFGDALIINALRIFYNELKNKKIDILSYQDQLNLLKILKSETTYNPRLSGYLTRGLLAKLSCISLLIENGKKQLGIDLDYVEKNKEFIKQVLTTIKELIIKLLTADIQSTDSDKKFF